MMDRKKYIVEASDDVKKVIAMGVTCGGAIWTDTTDIENLEEFNSDYINKHFSKLLQDAHDTGYKEGYAKKVEVMFDGEYQRGFEDGKALNDRGCDGCKYEHVTGEHLPCDHCCNCYTNQWESKNDIIEIGDVVQSASGTIYIVYNITPNRTLQCVSFKSRISSEFEEDEVRKTTIHVDTDVLV